MGMGRGSKKVPLLRAWAARCAATYSVELVLGQSTGSVVGGAHGCLYPCQRRSSVAGATTLVQRFRRYCDPRHRPQPIQTFVMAITNQASRFMSTYGTTYIPTTAGRDPRPASSPGSRVNCDQRAHQLQDVFDGVGADIGSPVIGPEDNAPRDNSRSRTPSLNMMLNTDARHFKNIGGYREKQRPKMDVHR